MYAHTLPLSPSYSGVLFVELRALEQCLKQRYQTIPFDFITSKITQPYQHTSYNLGGAETPNVLKWRIQLGVGSI